MVCAVSSATHLFILGYDAETRHATTVLSCLSEVDARTRLTTMVSVFRCRS